MVFLPISIQNHMGPIVCDGDGGPSEGRRNLKNPLNTGAMAVFQCFPVVETNQQQCASEFLFDKDIED